MPLIVEPSAVEEVYAEARERVVSLANICPDDRRSLEATLKATYEFGREIAVEDLPIIISFTGWYPQRPQLRLMTTVRDNLLGFELMMNDVCVFTSEDSPFHKLRVLTHLDHGHPEGDREILENRLDLLSTVMYDCSSLPFDENIRKTAEYAERVRGKVLVEGAVGEIYESGSGKIKDSLTTPEQAVEFMRKTGCFLIVPNLGTEHRASLSERKYHSDLARKITQALGPVIVLHGTSSLSPDELSRLKEDGVIKVNVWTAIAKAGGQAVARRVIENLGNYFSEEELAELRNQGYLGDRYFQKDYIEGVCSGTLSPRLHLYDEYSRRDAWIEAGIKAIKFYLEKFGYQRYAC